jgi:hypothetical protein
MKLLRLAFAAVLALGFSSAYAFHSGGVAECGGCHSMHTPAPGGSFLLIGSDQSSTCLSCHEHAGDTGPSSYHISTAEADMAAGVPPKQRTPGGDFGWLKKTYIFVVRGTTNTEWGESHGHNIVAKDKNYVADDINTTAPGGTFSAANLACNSCHDPHGQYRRLSTGGVSKTGGAIKGSGSYNAAANEPDATNPVGVYRLLAGNGYTKGGVTFPGVPAAKVPSTYNQTEVTNQVRVAYGVSTATGQVTWGNWCGTCHPSMHSTGNYVHPVDAPLGTTLANYNAYVMSGNMTGTQATSFSSLTPFTTNSGDYTALAALASNTKPTDAGPVDSDQVNCMSCHRAHATGWPEMVRWNMEGEFSVKGGVYGGTDTTPTDTAYSRGRTSAETAAAYYDRPVTKFANYQRVLCNKCHAKD